MVSDLGDIKADYLWGTRYGLSNLDQDVVYMLSLGLALELESQIRDRIASHDPKML